MRLYVQTVRKCLQKADEAKFNRQFPIHAEYHAISLCALAIGEPIPDARYVMEVYHLLQKAKREGNKRRIVQYTDELRKKSLQAQHIISSFAEKYQSVNTEENIRAEVYQPNSVGISAFEDVE